MMRRPVLILLIGVGSVVLFNLVRQTFILWNADQRITEAQSKVAMLKGQNERLKKDLEYYRTEDFVEREARNKLNLVRPGEVVVLVPSPTPLAKAIADYKDPNWKKWWKLLFE